MKEKETLERQAPPDVAAEIEDQPAEASPPGTQVSRPYRTNRGEGLIVGGAWLVAISLVVLAVYLAWQSRTPFAAANALQTLPIGAAVDDEAPAASLQAPEASEIAAANIAYEVGEISLPPVSQISAVYSIARRNDMTTVIPTRPRDDVITYTVVAGDSVFSIAKQFNLKPETVLWANYALLKDSPDTLSIGMDLFIPPVDGVLYEWKEGDSFASVASAFSANEEDILFWPGNDFDLVEPKAEPGQMVMVPGGRREFVQWIVPTIARGQAGVSKSVYGPGACEGSYDGAYGGGGFVWPSANRVLSGNDYWSGHLGIDIATGVGDGIFAADHGVVVFSGWAYGGYGNMIMIDHGNGYQTVYAHLNSTNVRCGQSVYQGNYIGASGNTGNSTGPHLHFEVRYMGGFINPWHVLP